jgi:hypothetical protein
MTRRFLPQTKHAALEHMAIGTKQSGALQSAYQDWHAPLFGIEMKATIQLHLYAHSRVHSHAALEYSSAALSSTSTTSTQERLHVQEDLFSSTAQSQPQQALTTQ